MAETQKGHGTGVFEAFLEQKFMLPKALFLLKNCEKLPRLSYWMTG